MKRTTEMDRPDGFVHVWDYPDDPDEPCWHEAAQAAVKYAAGIMALDHEIDFKIECQTVEWREKKLTNCVGANYILMRYDSLPTDNGPSITFDEIGFIIDGFMAGWMSRSCGPITIRDVHTEHCCKHSCKYGEEDCTVTTSKTPASYTCDFEEDNVSHN
jgi:hypothetical protein